MGTRTGTLSEWIFTGKTQIQRHYHGETQRGHKENLWHYGTARKRHMAKNTQNNVTHRHHMDMDELIQVFVLTPTIWTCLTKVIGGPTTPRSSGCTWARCATCAPAVTSYKTRTCWHGHADLKINGRGQGQRHVDMDIYTWTWTCVWAWTETCTCRHVHAAEMQECRHADRTGHARHATTKHLDDMKQGCPQVMWK